MSLSIVCFRFDRGGDRLGRVEGDEVVDISPAPPEGFVPHNDNWERVQDAPRRTVHSLSSVLIRPPVSPRKILCVELHQRGPDLLLAGRSCSVSISSKLPSAVIATGAPIMLPHRDPEVGFRSTVGLVVGRRRRHPGEPAISSIGGYTAMTDVIGRATEREDGNPTRARGFDTFGPLRPRIVSSADVDWNQLVLCGTVNDEIVEQRRLGELLPSIEDVLELFWPSIALHPGDVIAVGACDGSSPNTIALQPGDLLRVSAGVSGDVVNTVLQTE